MRNTFTWLLLLFFFSTHAQTICGTANEGGSVTLTVPPDNVITSIDFASYGTPNGSCGAFTIGGCHAANSMSIVEAAFVGQTSATLGATNGVFGDPCGGTVKRLYIQATYSSTLPLTLLSFTAAKTDNNTVKLDWSSEEETNTSHFLIEYSTNGNTYEQAGSVAAGGSGNHQYSFTTGSLKESGTYYFRLKMVDIDGKFKYSVINRIDNTNKKIILAVYPNPSTGTITISSGKKQSAIVTNNSGRVIKSVGLIKGTQMIDITSLSSGVYFIKAEDGVVKFIKK
jgi:hypothetical protein